jgi:hypothetical protein
MAEQAKRRSPWKLVGWILLVTAVLYFVALAIADSRFRRTKAEWDARVRRLVFERATPEQVAVEFGASNQETYTQEAGMGIDHKAWTRIDGALSLFPFDQTLAPTVVFDDTGHATSGEVQVWHYGILGL